MDSQILVFGGLVFFKQKTAYEMRISDWSSDVCSSDLVERDRVMLGRTDAGDHQRRRERPGLAGDVAHVGDAHAGLLGDFARDRFLDRFAGFEKARERRITPLGPRSEEQTSELQSLMRISYAVLCLKKKE